MVALGNGTHFLQQGGQLPVQLGGLCVDFVHAGAHRVHLALQMIRTAGALRHFALQAADGVLMVTHIGLQHGNGGLLLGHGAVQRRYLCAQALSLHIVFPHRVGAALTFGIHRVQRRLRPFLILQRGGVIALQLQRGGFQILQVLQPNGDLQHTQLVAQHQIFLRRCRLLAQRLHLQLQLRDLIVDAHQIFLGALELALGFLLAVAEFGDTCRLLKDLPAIAALDGQYLVDLALTDDGISLTAHTGVHEQLVDVLQAHGLLVDVILRFTAAVIAAGHRHLRLVPVEDMLGIVDDQRHLRKAHLAALFRAAEDHILHLGAAELAAVLLAHDPADGIGNIGLTAAVGAHNGGDVLTEVQYRFIGKRLKALDFQRF